MSKNKRSFSIKNRERSQSQRQLKVAQQINVALTNCLRIGSGLPRELFEKTPLTITKVTTSPDLRVAYCFFLPFNTSLTADRILTLLVESKYIIRNYITRNVSLKFSPEIIFYHDLVS